jgi:Domain of unknown function (DUF1611_C) P-loop domain
MQNLGARREMIDQSNLAPKFGILRPPVSLKKSSEASSVPLNESDDPDRTEKNNTYLIQDVVHSIKWSWACRVLDCGNYKLHSYASSNVVINNPKIGDVAVVCVERIGNHTSVVTTDNKKLRVYVGDYIVCVFGNRYATDAFEGEVIGTEDLSLLTAGGMIGTVKSKHFHDVKNPTRVSFTGYLVKEDDKRINLKQLKFIINRPTHDAEIKNLIVAVGTGMNSGKTTAARMLIRGLSEKGLKIAACKLTGSVSNRDQDEMRSASAKCIIDFSDYGFPSTYLATKQELIDLFNTMLATLGKLNPDVVIMEIADGILQRETNMLLTDSYIKKKTKGIVLAAESAPSALYGVEYLKNLGYTIIAVSGAMTSAPLFVREFQQHSKIHVASSVKLGKDLVSSVTAFINQSK